MVIGNVIIERMGLTAVLTIPKTTETIIAVKKLSI